MMVEAFDEWDVAKCENGYHRFFDQWAEKDIRLDMGWCLEARPVPRSARAAFTGSRRKGVSARVILTIIFG